MNTEEAKKLTYNFNGIELKGIISTKLTFEERMGLIQRFREYMDRHFPGIMEEIIEERDGKLRENPNPFTHRDKLHS